ncbi:MAG: sulfur carrier protein [Candidatus Endobugula sp.]
MLTISLNGEKVNLSEPLTINDLLAEKEYQNEKVALAINGSFVPRSQYGETIINDSDEVDVIQAVGGG